MLFLPASVATPNLVVQEYQVKTFILVNDVKRITRKALVIVKYHWNLLWEHLLPYRRQAVRIVAAMLPSSALHQKPDHYLQLCGTRSELCFSGIPDALPRSPEETMEDRFIGTIFDILSLR